MKIRCDIRYISLFESWSEKLNIAVLGIGFCVLMGWVFGIQPLKSVLPGLVTMKANTAAAFLLTGTSLWLLQPKRSHSKKICVVAKICASIAAAIGLLTMAEYIFGCNLGIDELLFRDDPAAVLTSSPGRMAITTAFNFFILGAALLTIDLETRRGWRPAQLLILSDGIISMVALVGYLYGVSAFYFGMASYTAMALHTVIAFLLLGASALLARPDRGLMAVFCSDTIGGTIMRILVPAIGALLIFFGWLKLAGHKAGIFNYEFGDALVVIVDLAVASFFIWWIAYRIDLSEAERIKTRDDLYLSNQEWDRTFNSISDMIFVMDKDRNIIRANKAFYDIMKLKPEDLVGKKCHTIFHGLNNPWPNCPYTETAEDLKPHTEEVDDPHIGMPLLITTSPVFDKKGEIVEVVHVSRDISELKKAENKLKQYSQQLEDALAIKTNFTSMVSHELRTPLTAIKEGISIILDGAAGKVNKEQAEFLTIAKRNVDRLARLINDILDFQRLEAGKMIFHMAENSVNECVREVEKMMKPFAERKALYLKIMLEEPLPKTVLDRDKIAQVLSNLVDNAVKFTEKGGVSIATKMADGFIEVSVGDTGVGIKGEDAPRLFQQFEQIVKGAERRTGGTGLGLAISKEIIEKHGGKIWIESVFGKGSIFHFTLPVK